MIELPELNILLRKLTASDSNSDYWTFYYNLIPMRKRLKNIRAENPNLYKMFDDAEKRDKNGGLVK